MLLWLERTSVFQVLSLRSKESTRHVIREGRILLDEEGRYLEAVTSTQSRRTLINL